MRSCLVVIGVFVVCGIVGVAALAFLGALVGDMPEGAPSAPKPPKEEMTADVSIVSGQLVVIPRTSYDWQDCRVELNDGWRVDDRLFPAGQMQSIPLGDFTKRDGERFSALRYRPQGVYFYCTTPHGRDGIGYNW